MFGEKARKELRSDSVMGYAVLDKAAREGSLTR